MDIDRQTDRMDGSMDGSIDIDRQTVTDRQDRYIERQTDTDGMYKHY